MSAFIQVIGKLGFAFCLKHRWCLVAAVSFDGSLEGVEKMCHPFEWMRCLK